MNTYAGPERREHVQLTEDQIDQIATRAATKAVEMMTASAYQEVGKRTVKGLLYIVGVRVAEQVSRAIHDAPQVRVDFRQAINAAFCHVHG